MTEYIDDPQHVNTGSCRWCGAAITYDSQLSGIAHGIKPRIEGVKYGNQKNKLEKTAL